MRKTRGNSPQHLLPGFLCNSNSNCEYTEGKRGMVYFFSFLHIEEREPYITFWRAVRQYKLGMCSRKCQDITQFLLKYFKRTNKNNPNILMGWVSQIIYIRICIPGNQERSRRERFLFFFPIHFFLPRPTIFLLPLPSSKKSLAFLQSQQTIFLQVFLLTILEACLAIL